MNIIEAMEQLKAGKAIQRTGWGNAKIQAVQLENGQYQIFASGDLTPEMLVLLSGDYDVNEAKETKDVRNFGRKQQLFEQSKPWHKPPWQRLA